MAGSTGATDVLNDGLQSLDSLTAHNRWSTIVLNFFPMFISIFICLYGRFFDDLLRIICVFLVAVYPMLAEVLTPWWEGKDLDLNVTDTVSLFWALGAGFAAAYTALVRREFGIKVQMIGVAFTVVMIVNSYYIGDIHRYSDVYMPGAARWFNWLNFAMVVLGTAVLVHLRDIPLVGEIVCSCINAGIGGLMLLQILDTILSDLNVSVTEGLSWKMILSEEFGCTHTDCKVFVTVMLGVTAFGALNNYIIWKHHEATLLGRHSVLCIPIMTQIYHKIQDSMTVLNNLNEAVAIYSKGLSDEEEVKLELDIQRDMYNVVGLLTDIYMVVYSFAMVVHVAEMANAGIFSYAETQLNFTLTICLLCILGLATTAFGVKTRLLKETIGSLPWKKQTMHYMLFVGVTWPFLLFGTVYTGILGGPEVAALDVPMVNNYAGFATLPLGCDTVRNTGTAWCDWVAQPRPVNQSTSQRVNELGFPTVNDKDLVHSAAECAEAVARYRYKPTELKASSITGVTWGRSGKGSGQCWAQIGLKNLTGVSLVPGSGSEWQTCMPTVSKFKSIARPIAEQCRDRVSNHGEEGVDCGGLCQHQCSGCQCTQSGKSGGCVYI